MLAVQVEGAVRIGSSSLPQGGRLPQFHLLCLHDQEALPASHPESTTALPAPACSPGLQAWTLTWALAAARPCSSRRCWACWRRWADAHAVCSSECVMR